MFRLVGEFRVVVCGVFCGRVAAPGKNPTLPPPPNKKPKIYKMNKNNDN